MAFDDGRLGPRGVRSGRPRTTAPTHVRRRLDAARRPSPAGSAREHEPARACRWSTSSRRARVRPRAPSEDDYKWHTYKVYPSGRPDAVEFIDTLQVVRALAHPARAEHGPARGDGVDDPRAVRHR